MSLNKPLSATDEDARPELTIETGEVTGFALAQPHPPSIAYSSCGKSRQEVIDPQVGFASLAPTAAFSFNAVYRGQLLPYRAVFVNAFNAVIKKPHRATVALWLGNICPMDSPM
jgi:hypothetical protein